MGGNGGAGGAGSTGSVDQTGSAGAAGAGGIGIVGSGLTVINSGTIIGGMSGDGVTQADAIDFTGGTNTLTLTKTSVLTGNIEIDAGTVTFNQSTAVSLGNVITGGGGVIDSGAGTLILSGANTYTGATTVDAGTLEVTGAITASSDVTVNGGTLNVTGSVADPTVNAGGTLTGTGSVGDTTINAGGFFTPGDGTPGASETVNGNLTLASGSTYQIYLNPTTSSLANVSGTAALGGTAQANFAGGSYISKNLYDPDGHRRRLGHILGRDQCQSADELHRQARLRCQQRLSGSHAELRAAAYARAIAGRAEPQSARRRQHAGQLFQHERRHSDEVRRAAGRGFEPDRW